MLPEKLLSLPKPLLDVLVQRPEDSIFSSPITSAPSTLWHPLAVRLKNGHLLAAGF